MSASHDPSLAAGTSLRQRMRAAAAACRPAGKRPRSRRAPQRLCTRRGSGWLRALLLSGCVGAAVCGCATNPVTGGTDFVMISESQEIAIGREADPDVRREFGVYDDAGLNAYVQRLGSELAQKSHRPDLIYRFTVLDSPDVNAFALPGGYIYITRGLMAYLNSEAELAAVLGHEIGHVTARHSVRQISASQAAGIGYTVGAIFLPELRTQSAQQLFNVLGTSLIRGYGRGHELEADRLGAEYLARSGYDPDAMIEVIGVLKNQETAEQQLAAQEGREPRVYHGLFATHPSNDRRLQVVVGEARKFKTGAATSIGRDAYLDRIDGLRFGDSPAQGIRRGNLFYHEELDFKLTFPAGWRLENYPDRLEAASPDNQAQMLVLAQDRNRRISPREFIVTRLNQSNLTAGRELDVGGLEAYTGIGRFDTVFGRRDTRVTVLYYHDKAYIFLGAVRSGPVTARDGDFLATPSSFRPLSDEDRRYARGLSLRVVQAGLAERISDLAARSAPMNYPELQLRLINDLFPGGEPHPAQRVKIVQ